jgi:hypothetical protein
MTSAWSTFSRAVRHRDHLLLQKHALYEEPAFVYLDVKLEQLRISDANALLLPDQKSSRNKKHRQYNVPAQEPSMIRLQHSTADSDAPADSQVGMLSSWCPHALQGTDLCRAKHLRTACWARLQGSEDGMQPTFTPEDDAASTSDATVAPDAESSDE